MLAAVFALLKAIPALSSVVNAILNALANAHEESKAAASDAAMTTDLTSIDAFVAKAKANAGPAIGK